MSTTRCPHPRPPRVLAIRGRRTAGIALTLATTALGLSACGLIGGNTNHGSAPVVIPTVGTGAQAGVASTGAAGANSAPARAGSTQASTSVLVSGGVTVTRTGYLVRTQVNVQTSVATKTLPAQTKLVTQAPVTNTQTQTVTQTPAAKTVTMTVTSTIPCAKAPCP